MCENVYEPKKRKKKKKNVEKRNQNHSIRAVDEAFLIYVSHILYNNISYTVIHIQCMIYIYTMCIRVGKTKNKHTKETTCEMSVI